MKLKECERNYDSEARIRWKKNKRKNREEKKRWIKRNEEH